jgi:hypothetical protein
VPISSNQLSVALTKKPWSEKLDEFYTEEIEWETLEEREHVMEAWRGLLQADGS